MRGAVTDLRALASVSGEDIPPSALEDLQRIFSLAITLEEQLAAPSTHHDLMNTLSAIRGYAEMLQEDIGAQQPALNDSLTRLLKATENASVGAASGVAAQRAPAMAAEPGFILAVDDLAENRELVARYLSRSGHLVVTAASGAEALRALAESDVDVVLLDLMMPDMDGREVLRRIKANPCLLYTSPSPRD